MSRYCERTCSVLEKNVLHDIMTTCTILHNMIIEDEREFDAPTELYISKVFKCFLHANFVKYLGLGLGLLFRF